MTLELLPSESDEYEFAINRETGWVFAKARGSDEWRYVVSKDVQPLSTGRVELTLTTASLRSLTCRP